MISFKRILCPTDFSNTSLDALPYAVELARLFESEIFMIHVVHVLPNPPADLGYNSQVAELASALRADAERQLDTSVRKQIPSEIKTTKILVQGRPAEEILRAVKEYKIDLIVLATHGFTGLSHLVFGSVAEKVVRLSKVPVLTTRSTKTS